jgi:predicted hydrocarbon binding protein
MHGILFKQLKTYVESEWGEDAWSEAMDEAGIEPKLYLPVTDYPDEEALRLLDGVTTVTGAREEQLVEDLGEFMAPALLDTFKAHVMDEWDAMDLLEHTDNEVFAVLRSEGGVGDEVTARREDDRTVVLEYTSDLELCSLACGMLRGLVEEHGEDVDVTEQSCMDHGADACEIRVRRA